MNKKFALLLVLVAALVMGSITSASAADIKASGSWQIEANLRGNQDFLGKGASTGEDKTLNIEQRMRTAFQFIANENLKGVLELQIGTSNWGSGLYAIGSGRTAGASTTAGSGGANNGGAGNLMLRKGYVDFKWPGTKVNFLVGYQSLSLPSAVGGGSPVLDDHFAAAAAVVPVMDGLSLVGGYGRLLDSNSNAFTTAGSLTGSGTTADVAFMYANIDMIKGISIQPWIAYANMGDDTVANGMGVTALGGFNAANSSSNEGVRAYWGGAAFTMTLLDPFKVMADFNYGKATWNNQSASNKASGGRQGFLGDIAVDYTGLKMMTPSVFFAYSSGEGGNSTDGNGKSERMPVVGNPQNYALGSFWLQGGDAINGNMYAPSTTMGYWALGLSLKDIKLIDKLSHTVHLIYFKGTNDPDYLKENTTGTNAAYGQFLTTKDSLWEVDLNTKYQIYDELALGLELGYINADFDKNTWGAATLANAAQLRQYGSKDAYKATLLLNYSF